MQQLDKFASIQDISKFINKHGKKCNFQTVELKTILDIFDFNKDGFLDFEDFLLFLLPQSNQDLMQRLEFKAEIEREGLNSPRSLMLR